MLKIDCIAAFVAVAEAGSISEAARRLQMSRGRRADVRETVDDADRRRQVRAGTFS
jgi:hypothetical protein